jgi:hypothetical protein
MRVFPFFLLLFGLTQAGSGCVPSTTLAAQRLLAADGAVTATVFAGHKQAMLTLRASWSSPMGPSAGAIILPGNSTLLQQDVAAGWYDGQSPATLEELLFTARNERRHWKVSAGPASLPVGILNLGPDSPLWLQHDTVAFTGSQLHFAERTLGRPCSALDALDAVASKSSQSARHLTLAFGTSKVHNLSIHDTVTGRRIGQWPVLIGASPDAAQTLLPPDTLATLELGTDFVLMLDERVLLGRYADVATGRLFAPAPPTPPPSPPKKGKRDVGKAPVVAVVPGMMFLGRRLLQEVAVAWAVDAEGHLVARLVTSSPPTESSSGTDSVPEGVYWVTFLAGTVLMWFTAYWTSSLALTLRLRYAPPTAREGAVVTRRDIGYGYLVLLLSVLTHVLMLVYAGHDVLLDTSLESPLNTFVIVFACGSLAAAIPYAAILIYETIRELRWPNDRLIPIQVFAVLQGAITARGVLAGLLVGAGAALPQLALANLVSLAFVFFPSVYAALILLAHLLGGVRLYLPSKPTVLQARTTTLVVALVVAVMVALSVGLGVTQSLDLLYPFFNVLNAYYTPELISAAVWVTMLLPVAAACFSVTQAAKALLQKHVDRLGKRLPHVKRMRNV